MLKTDKKRSGLPDENGWYRVSTLRYVGNWHAFFRIMLAIQESQ
ncbi:hypothetical protein [Streptococcus sp. X16XC17]|nr:hypothetical protein [Streptococcus sp. X16XC17]